MVLIRLVLYVSANTLYLYISNVMFIFRLNPPSPRYAPAPTPSVSLSILQCQAWFRCVLHMACIDATIAARFIFNNDVVACVLHLINSNTILLLWFYSLCQSNYRNPPLQGRICNFVSRYNCEIESRSSICPHTRSRRSLIRWS